ncbi:uncharacterized protein LOC130503625 isoform X1 [Raphanus sativus]|uniref:Uncharacterized protein LOC108830839 isoform X1 n=1 Tax=Raphanus sativus TaxID=3726 RepID=A0A6J0LIZ7_RAPSA|nr:uncharacterized protein LOC108830839 isoform X1 [Raphanus sativus]XP_056853181.1 uncharacterized protein LOC130502410 isoform X1 [Raphanus sativus]XP_056854231.1 uncharacterized protein LOC130503625 isoform X1 [Raphanus sativus]
MSSVEDLKANEEEKSMPSPQQEEAAVKNKYGGLMPKKPPLISKVGYIIYLCLKRFVLCVFLMRCVVFYLYQDHERAYFDSADWALGKQGVAKPKGPLEALRPKLQPTQQQTRYRKSPCAPSEGGQDGGGASQTEGVSGNEE